MNTTTRTRRRRMASLDSRLAVLRSRLADRRLPDPVRVQCAIESRSLIADAALAELRELRDARSLAA